MYTCQMYQKAPYIVVIWVIFFVNSNNNRNTISKVSSCMWQSINHEHRIKVFYNIIVITQRYFMWTTKDAI